MTVLLESHGSLEDSNAHHLPPTTRSQGGEETRGNFTERISAALSESWNNMDNLLISDAHSFVRKSKCREVWSTLLKRCMVCQTWINSKHEGLVIKCWMLTVAFVCMKILLRQQVFFSFLLFCFLFFFFFLPACPTLSSFSSSSLYWKFSCCAQWRLCLPKRPSHCYMPGWRQYPLAPTLYQDRVFTS